jgi:hypothetical protein
MKVGDWAQTDSTEFVEDRPFFGGEAVWIDGCLD